VRALTGRQREILDFLVRCVREDHYTPTVREIADHFGMRSTNAARGHLEALERKGVLSRRAGASRGIQLSDEVLAQAREGVPVVGRVAAGTPITAVENLEGYLEFDSLFRHPERLYALRVQGDSMIDAGIWHGDYVLVEQAETVPDGAIGVAIVDEEATVKRIRRRADHVELAPANPAYKPVKVDPDATGFRTGGRVVGVHRVLG